MNIVIAWSKLNNNTPDVPTKLVKLASNVLSTPLAIAINNSLASSFPVNAPDKKTDDKYDISNFQPLCL